MCALKFLSKIKREMKWKRGNWQKCVHGTRTHGRNPPFIFEGKTEKWEQLTFPAIRKWQRMRGNLFPVLGSNRTITYHSDTQHVDQESLSSVHSCFDFRFPHALLSHPRKSPTVVSLPVTRRKHEQIHTLPRVISGSCEGEAYFAFSTAHQQIWRGSLHSDSNRVDSHRSGVPRACMWY